MDEYGRVLVELTNLKMNHIKSMLDKMKLYACMDKLKHKIAKLDEQIKLKGGK